MLEQPVAQGARGEGLAGAGRHLDQRPRVGLLSERSRPSIASTWQARRPAGESGGMPGKRRRRLEPAFSVASKVSGRWKVKTASNAARGRAGR